MKYLKTLEEYNAMLKSEAGKLSIIDFTGKLYSIYMWSYIKYIWNLSFLQRILKKEWIFDYKWKFGLVISLF